MMGINVVPSTNPDVVPRFTSRETESVDPLCTASCAPDPDAGDDTIKTSGMCRKKTADSGVALCASASPVHRIKWANPALTGVPYDANTVQGAKPGDYLAFEWDDVVHDVWMVPSDAQDPCAMVTNSTDPALKEAHANASGAELVIATSHHATVDPFTMDTVVEGRNLFKIPVSAAGFKLLFVCSMNGHCNTGQQLGVNVGPTLATPNPKLTDPDGVCEKGFTLCPDQSKQTTTYAKVETNVNVPWTNFLAAANLKLSGSASRAKTPWEDFKYRRVNAKTCQWRKQNTRVSHRAEGEAAGIDHRNQAVWQFDNHNIRDVVQACSTSHPDACVGIAWRAGDGIKFTPNGTMVTTPLLNNPTSRTYKESPRRAGGYLGSIPGWIPGSHNVGNWMQIDLGSDRKVDGVVSQARGNAGHGSMRADFKVMYSKSNTPANFTTVPGVFKGPTEAEWNADVKHRTTNMLPETIEGRYIRFVIEKAYSSMVALRAGLLMHTPKPDPFVGKHKFRRCLESDRYMKIVTVGKLTWEESQALNQTVPKDITKSVSCPGCYQCREVPIAPNTGSGEMYHGMYGTYALYQGQNRLTPGFHARISNPGKSNAVLTIHQWEPLNVGEPSLTWANWAPQFMCRIDPQYQDTDTSDQIRQRLEPDLEDDDEWVTFLKPGVGTQQTDPTAEDTVIDAMADGFQPMAAVQSLMSTDQANLAVVYPPGPQVDPTITSGPNGGDWNSRGWSNMTHAAAAFILPPQQINGSRGGGWWPPKPVIKVSFMPVIQAGTGRGWRLYPYKINYPTASDGKVAADEHNMAVLKGNVQKDGWFVDEGALEGAKNNTYTGETAKFGWRCEPKMAWYEANWHDKDGAVVPPFVHGAARSIGTYKGASHQCPDGRVNAWEATVANGVYMVTSGFSSNGCTFENVRGAGASATSTVAFSVEVSDGKFTLSSGIPSSCSAVSWIKLDLISSTLFPKVWLPSPRKEWWQSKLDGLNPNVGLVQIILPHQAYRTAQSYPHWYDMSFPDCRQGWMYAPAKCPRMFTTSKKRGVHPDLAVYPDFPGFSQPFLEWLFDRHDTNNDGELSRGEFSAAQSNETLHGPFALWQRPAGHNTKGTPGFHDDAVMHIWRKLDVIDGDRTATGGISRGDSKVTRDEFIHGPLSMPQDRPCDLFESTSLTHGSNLHNGNICHRKKAGQLPTNYGIYNDDGSHGFIVTISDVPCTDNDGCPEVGDADANVTLCAKVLSTTNSLIKINCHGASGKYVQILLPGDKNRLLPNIKVDIHRASHPNIKDGRAQAYKSTDSKLPTVCYGVQRRAVPAADSPDLLAGTKEHPKIVIDNNPEDPIFWSTCYERVKIRDWIPLVGAIKVKQAEGEYRFNDGKQCLDCYSMKQNMAREHGYDMDHMRTPRWWLQPKGQCAACVSSNTSLAFNYTTRPPSTAEPTTRCPKTHPWAYRPEADFDYCCSSPDNKEGNAGINMGPRSKRGRSCKRNHFTKCSNPPCGDYSAGYMFGVTGSDVCPNGMAMATIDECEAAHKAVLPVGAKPSKGLQSNYWWHVPHGCSSQHIFKSNNADSWYAPHFSTDPNGHNRNKAWIPVCHKSHDDKTAATPMIGLHRIASCDQCKAITGKSLCDKDSFQREDLMVARGGRDGVVGAPLAELGCGVLDLATPASTPASNWVLRANGTAGQSGCPGSSLKESLTQASFTECTGHCASAGSRYLQYHDSGFCGCFAYCDFSKAAADYQSKAMVYEYALNTSTASSLPFTVVIAAAGKECSQNLNHLLGPVNNAFECGKLARAAENCSLSFEYTRTSGRCTCLRLVDGIEAPCGQRDDSHVDRWTIRAGTRVVDKVCSAMTCTACQGDCDSDNDCGAGLRCFQRHNASDTVPGCALSGYAESSDYCFDPIQGGTPVVDKGDSGCSSSNVCTACEGDCDDDSDCGSGLKCFQRVATSDAVPGCSAGYVSSNHDYCYADNPPPSSSGAKLGVKGQTSCPARMVSVVQSACESANARLLPTGKTLTRAMQVGSWSFIPPGCNTQSGGDYTAHFNTHATGGNDGAYTSLCTDIGTGLFFGGRGANTCPVGSMSVSQRECDAVNKALLGLGTQPGRALQVGSWAHLARGCSTQNGGDNTAHYNTHATSKNTATSFSPVCKGGPELIPAHKSDPGYAAWRKAARHAYKIWRSEASDEIYIAIPTTVTLHLVTACDECTSRRSNLCTGFEVDNAEVGTGKGNGVVGPRLSEVGCGLLEAPYRIWRNTQGLIYVAVASPDRPETTTTTATTTHPSVQCDERCSKAMDSMRWRRSLRVGVP